MACLCQYTILLFSFFFFFFSYYFYVTPFAIHYEKHNQSQDTHNERQMYPIMRQDNVYTTQPKDTLLNPYAPPLQYNEPHHYKQLGYLKNESHDKKLFPLFGKPTQYKRDKWYYYTIYDNIKVPLFVNNRDCSTEIGCDYIQNGDLIHIEGIKDSFTTSLYKNNTLSYNPEI